MHQLRRRNTTGSDPEHQSFGGELSFLRSGVLFVAVSLLVGCGKAPEPPVQQAAKAPPEEVTELAGSSLPLEETPTEAQSENSSTPAPVQQQYSKPETQRAVQNYAQAWQQLQADGQAGAGLGSIDPFTNPGAITDYANRIGQDANQLDQAERSARGLMNPQEKKRFKAFEQDLQENN